MKTIFSLNKNQTILSAYLNLLNVKHAKKYANKLYNGNQEKNKEIMHKNIVYYFFAIIVIQEAFCKSLSCV